MIKINEISVDNRFISYKRFSWIKNPILSFDNKINNKSEPIQIINFNDLTRRKSSSPQSRLYNKIKSSMLKTGKQHKYTKNSDFYNIQMDRVNLKSPENNLARKDKINQNNKGNNINNIMEHKRKKEIINNTLNCNKERNDKKKIRDIILSNSLQFRNLRYRSQIKSKNNPVTNSTIPNLLGNEKTFNLNISKIELNFNNYNIFNSTFNLYNNSVNTPSLYFLKNKKYKTLKERENERKNGRKKIL